MRRTQIYLDPDLAESLDRLARRRGTTRAEVIRSAARREVTDDDAERDRDPIWQIVGIGKSGVTDASVNHDKYLYEDFLRERQEFQEYERRRKRRS